ncbi:MAG TPA: 2-oxoglutarate dehydrogenase complex dihydrolipoyllysine-residue succinyltransferase [Geobacteraceae bacterium]
MDIKVPEVGESVFEALIAKWYKNDGEAVAKDEPLCEIETDKITLEIAAEVAGVLSIGVKAGETVKIGTVIGSIAEGTGVPASKKKDAAGPVKSAAPTHVSPSERKFAREAAEKPSVAESKKTAAEKPLPPPESRREEAHPALPQAEGRVTRQAMTPIRKRIAERLLAARQQTAMLTTFNEADMTRVIALRTKHKEDFLRKHGVSLGFMSFFVKACTEALAEFPAVNARIDGSDIVYQHFYDIGIAVSGEKGLVVPVVRDANRLTFAEIEHTIADFVERIGSNRLALADLEGGTFTISNGGVFGSLLSTPILNPPQSGVLGMHAIQDRPVARDGKVVIRPMMYIALSYDHRIIDGREAVGFLRKVKELIEDPEEMLVEG